MYAPALFLFRKINEEMIMPKDNIKIDKEKDHDGKNEEKPSGLINKEVLI